MSLFLQDYYDDEEEGYADEYEEEGEEEQEAVREPPKPTKEEKDFLSIREKLKEKFRQKLLKERASTFGRSAVRETLTSKTPSQEKYVYFFFPPPLFSFQLLLSHLPYLMSMI